MYRTAVLLKLNFEMIFNQNHKSTTKSKLITNLNQTISNQRPVDLNQNEIKNQNQFFFNFN